MGGKWPGLLKEIAPAVERLGFLFNPDTAPYAESLAHPGGLITVREAFQVLGWTNGRNVRIDYRWVTSDIEKPPEDTMTSGASATKSSACLRLLVSFRHGQISEAHRIARIASTSIATADLVSKKLDAPYKSGPSQAWLKIKNQKAPAATRTIDGTF